MASTSSHSHSSGAAPSASPAPEPLIQTVPPTADSGVPTEENRAAGSTEGRACHQCRQKIRDIFARCKNLKRNKQCSIKLCHRCLRNRYAEKAEEVVLLSDWHCPKCRGVCNCSVCMKKRGQNPTGILAPKAKKSGFTSVSEMLNTVGAADNLNEAKRPKRSAETDKEILGEGLNDDMIIGNEEEGSSSRKESSKRLKVSNEMNDHLPLEIGEAGPQNANEAGAKPKPKRGRPKKEKVQDQEVTNIPLPQGAELNTVAGMDMSNESVGHALQFLEFCATFGEALDLQQGRAESVLREIVQGQDQRQCQFLSTVQLQIQLLELIQKDSLEKPPTLSLPENENSWLEVLGKCISESVIPMTSLPSTSNNYAQLAPLEKLRLLNFLCDEALSTAYMRGWIEEENAKFDDRKKSSKQKIMAAKEKAKCLKQKLQDEVAAAPLSVPEHEALVAQIKEESAQAHAEVLEAMGAVPNKGEKCAALRIEPLLLDESDGNGCVFWRLRYCGDAPDLLLQDIGTWDAISPGEEKWVAYDPELKPEVKKYISSKKVKSHRKRQYKKVLAGEVDTLASDAGEVAEPVLTGEVAEPVLTGEVADQDLTGERETMLKQEMDPVEGEVADHDLPSKQETQM